MSDIKTALLQAVEARKQELFDLLSALVRIDSQNFASSGREKAAAAYIADELRSLGLSPDVYSPMDVPGLPENPDYWDGHHLEDRPNVTACRPGTGSRRLMLAAHSDTVPVGDPASWSFDPFAGCQRDGKIWGRGACDDKYGIAAALFLLRLLRDLDITLPYDLFFTAYCDEENGGSNGALASCLKYPCEDIANLDCKNFEIWAVAAGGGEIEAFIRSEKPLDSCGKMMDGLMILRDEFERLKERRVAELSEVPLYKGTVIPDTSVRFLKFQTGNGSSDLDRGQVKLVFYTTLDKAAFDLELDELAVRADARLRPLGLRFDRFERPTRHFIFNQTELENNPAMDALIRAGAEVSGRELAPRGSCLSDLSVFLKYGSPRAFSFGIGRDFDEYGGAHQFDEFIECGKLVEFTKILAAFLLDYSA